MRNYLFPTVLFDLLIIGILVLALTYCGKDPIPAPPELKSVQVGTPAVSGMLYHWDCGSEAIIDNPNIAQPMVSVKKATVCTVTASSQCGVSKASMTINVQ